MRHEEIEKLVSQIDRAIVVASGRLANLKLRVAEVELTVKIEFVGKVEGGVDIGIVKIGTSVTSGRTSEITVAFKPRTVMPVAGIEDRFIDALEVIQRALSSLDEKFELTSAAVEIGFEVTAEGKVAVVIGGEGSHSVTHAAKLKLQSIV